MPYDVSTDPYFKDEIHHDAPQRIARRMLERFDSSTRWTKNAFARDAHGTRVDPGSPDVTCCCIHTCMVKSCDDLGLTFSDLDRTWKAFDRVVDGITAFNDHPSTTFADIIRIIRTVADEKLH